MNPNISASRIDTFDGLCVGALLLSFALVGLLPFAPSKYADIYFHTEAKTLANIVRGRVPYDQIVITHAPGPDLYYAVPYLLVSPTSSDEVYWRTAVAWNAFWMLGAILLIRRTGELLGDAGTGRIAAILALGVPCAVYYAFGIAAETPAYVATVVFTYGWVRWRTQPTGRFLSPAGILAFGGLVALFLCRPNALVLAGLAGVCGAILWRTRRSASRTADLRFALIAIAAGLAVVMVVSVALKQLPGRRGVALQASNFREVFFHGSFQFRSEPWDWRFWGKATRQGSVDYQYFREIHDTLVRQASATGTQVTQLELNWVLHDMVQHPGKRLQMIAVRLAALNVWIVNSTRPADFRFGPIVGWPAYLSFHLILNGLLLFPLGVSVWFVATNRSNLLSYWPLWGLWVVLLIFHAIVYAEPRYMLPGQPGLTIMAASMISRKLRATGQLRFRKERRAVVGVSLRVDEANSSISKP